MSRVAGTLAALLCIAAAAGPALAEGPAGAASCSGCHGATGPVPSLAGRPAAEIVAEMQAFRAGTRAATVMDRIAKGFSDEETRAIADRLAGRGAHGGKP